jgi:chorismate mutase
MAQGTPDVGDASHAAQTAQMEDYRKSIDNLDSALIAILAERFRMTEKIGLTKSAAGLAPLDPERERQQFENFRALAGSFGLDVQVVADVMGRIIQHAKNRHEVLMRGG